MDNPSYPIGAGMGLGAQHPGNNLAQKVVAYILREFVEGLVSLRTRDLISNLVDLNAIEEFIGRREHCDVGALLRQSLERHQLAAARRQIIFLSGVYGNLWTEADPAVLRQVFDKIISNAVKYSPANSTIQVHALIENGGIVVNVRDQGVGVNEEGRQKLFQKFAGLVACPSGAASSAGVRLAIVKKLAETLSGSVRWRSALGSGSTFTLKLPVSTAPAETVDFSEIKMLARNIVESPVSLPRFASRN
ncbi:MAG TPA: HAMP domain-containing sensor histidine kinase [Verrucomicrobiae bacterium]|nr:HAMP domain-containing sensor histidine kinase [Verrucomicrobiae bacterium]